MTDNRQKLHDAEGRRELLKLSAARMDTAFNVLHENARMHHIDHGERGVRRQWELPLEHFEHSAQLLIDDLRELDVKVQHATFNEAKAEPAPDAEVVGKMRKRDEYARAKITHIRLTNAATRAIAKLDREIARLKT